MAPPKTKSRLTIRESRSNSDSERSSGNESDGGKNSDSSGDKTKRGNNKLQTNDSGIHFVKNGQKEAGTSDLKKTTKNVIESVSSNKPEPGSEPSSVDQAFLKNASKNTLLNPLKKDLARGSKKLPSIPRETKASFLRKKLQSHIKQASLENKAKSAVKSPSPSRKQKTIKHEFESEDETSGEFLRQYVARQKTECGSDSAVLRETEDLIETLGLGEEFYKDLEKEESIKKALKKSSITSEEPSSNSDTDVESPTASKVVKQEPNRYQAAKDGYENEGLENVTNRTVPVEDSSEKDPETADREVDEIPPNCATEEALEDVEAAPQKEPETEDEEVDEIPPNCATEDEFLEDVETAPQEEPETEDEEVKEIPPNCATEDEFLEDVETGPQKEQDSKQDQAKQSAQTSTNNSVSLEVIDKGFVWETEDEEIDDIPSDCASEEISLEPENTAPHRDTILEDNLVKDVNNGHEQVWPNYSDDSFEGGNSSVGDEKTPSLDSDLIPLGCESKENGAPDHNNDSAQESQRDQTDSDASDVVETPESPVLSDEEIDDLDAQLFGSLHKAKQPAKIKDKTQGRDEYTQKKTSEKTAAVEKKNGSPTSEQKGAKERRIEQQSANSDQVSNNSLQSNFRKLAYSKKDNGKPPRQKCLSPPVRNPNLDPFAASFADDLDDLLDEVEETIEEDERSSCENVPGSVKEQVGDMNSACSQDTPHRSIDNLVELTFQDTDERDASASDPENKIHRVKSNSSYLDSTSAVKTTQKLSMVDKAGTRTDANEHKNLKDEGLINETQVTNVSDEIRQLIKLHTKIATLRKAFSGKEEAQVADILDKMDEPDSHFSLLQNVRAIVTSIVEMSEDLKDGIQVISEASSKHNDALQRDLTHMREEYVEALDKQHAKIKSLTEEKEDLRVRLENVLGELEPQIKSLQETNEDLILQLQERDVEKSSMEYLVQSANQLNDKLSEEIDELELKMENSYNDICRLQKEIEKQDDEVKFLTDNIMRLEDQLHKSNQERQKVETEKSELCKQVESLDENLKDAQSEMCELRNMLESTKTELNEERATKQRNVLENKDSDMKTLQDKIKDLEGELKLYTDEKLNMEAEKNTLHERANGLIQHLKDAQFENMELQNKLEYTEAELKKEAERSTETNNVKSLNDKIVELEAELGMGNKLRRKVETEKDELNQQVKGLEEQLKDARTEICKLRAALHSMKVDLEERSTEHRNGLQVLEERNYEMNKLQEKIKKMKDQLEIGDQEKRKAQTLVESVEAEKNRLGEQVDSLEQNLKNSESIASEIQNKFKYTILELEEARSLEHTKHLHDLEKKDSEIKELKNMVEELGIQLKKGDDQRQLTHSNMNSEEAENATLRKQIEGLEKELKTSHFVSVRLESELTDATAKLDKETSRKEEMEMELSGMKKEILVEVNHCEELQKALDIGQEEKLKLRNEIDSMNKVVNQCREGEVCLQDQIQQLKKELQALKNGETKTGQTSCDSVHLGGEEGLLFSTPVGKEATRPPAHGHGRSKETTKDSHYNQKVDNHVQQWTRHLEEKVQSGLEEIRQLYEAFMSTRCKEIEQANKLENRLSQNEKGTKALANLCQEHVQQMHQDRKEILSWFKQTEGKLDLAASSLHKLSIRMDMYETQLKETTISMQRALLCDKQREMSSERERGLLEQQKERLERLERQVEKITSTQMERPKNDLEYMKCSLEVLFEQVEELGREVKKNATGDTARTTYDATKKERAQKLLEADKENKVELNKNEEQIKGGKLDEIVPDEEGERVSEGDEEMTPLQHTGLAKQQQDLDDNKKALKEKGIALAYAESCIQMLAKPAKLTSDSNESKMTNSLLQKLVEKMKVLEILLHENLMEKAVGTSTHEPGTDENSSWCQGEADGRNQLRESVADKDKKLDEMGSFNVPLKGDLEAARTSLMERDVELQELKNYCLKKDEELRKVNEELRQMELESSKWKNISEEGKYELEQEKNSLRAKIAMLECRLRDQKNELARMNERLNESREEMTRVRTVLNGKESKIDALEITLEKKEQEVMKMNESLDFKEEEMKRLKDKLDEVNMEKWTLVQENKQMIRDVELARQTAEELKGLRTSFRQKIHEEDILKDNMDKIAQEKRELKRTLGEKEKKNRRLEKLVFRIRQNFENMSTSLQEKDDEIRQVVESKEKKMDMLKSSLRQAEKEATEWKAFMKERECQLKEMNESLKENSKDLEAIIYQQQRDIKGWKDIVTEKEEDLKRIWDALEESRKELEEVKGLMVGMECRGNGLKTQQSYGEEGDHRQCKNNLEKINTLQTQLDKFKTENMELTEQNRQIEKNLETLKAKAQQEGNKDWLLTLKNTLDHARCKKGHEPILKTQGGQEVTSDLGQGSSLQQTVVPNNMSEVDDFCKIQPDSQE